MMVQLPERLQKLKKRLSVSFKDFLQHEPADYEEVSVNYLSDLLPNKCTQGKKDMLIREVTDEEIREFIFSMSSNKSPGPDG